MRGISLPLLQQSTALLLTLAQAYLLTSAAPDLERGVAPLMNYVQETGIKTIHMENKCQKAKWLSEAALQIAVKRRQAKSKGEKEIYSHLNAEFQRIARRDKKAFLSD